MNEINQQKKRDLLFISLSTKKGKLNSCKGYKGDINDNYLIFSTDNCKINNLE